MTNNNPHTIPIRTLKEEAKFYNDAQHTYDHLEDFKKKIMRQNQEFNTLLQYYQQNEGRIDFSSVMDGNGGLLPHRPNVGTDNQSWFYLDERGNKVWVQNMRLDTSDVRTGAFAANQHADGKVIVVKVPTHKKNYCLQPDYKKKCAEYDSYRRLQQLQNPSTRPSSAYTAGVPQQPAAGRVGSASPTRAKYPMVPPFSNPANGAASWVPGATAALPTQPVGHCWSDQTDLNRYVASQQRLAEQVQSHQREQYYAAHHTCANPYLVGPQYPQQQGPSTAPLLTAGGQYVYRPPTSVEEADARLAELRREEAWLMQQAHTTM